MELCKSSNNVMGFCPERHSWLVRSWSKASRGTWHKAGAETDLANLQRRLPSHFRHLLGSFHSQQKRMTTRLSLTFFLVVESFGPHFYQRSVHTGCPLLVRFLFKGIEGNLSYSALLFKGIEGNLFILHFFSE